VWAGKDLATGDLQAVELAADGEAERLAARRSVQLGEVVREVVHHAPGTGAVDASDVDDHAITVSASGEVTDVCMLGGLVAHR
jgi:hypothetical protein